MSDLPESAIRAGAEELPGSLGDPSPLQSQRPGMQAFALAVAEAVLRAAAREIDCPRCADGLEPRGAREDLWLCGGSGTLWVLDPGENER